MTDFRLGRSNAETGPAFVRTFEQTSSRSSRSLLNGNILPQIVSQAFKREAPARAAAMVRDFDSDAIFPEIPGVAGTTGTMTWLRTRKVERRGAMTSPRMNG